MFIPAKIKNALILALLCVLSACSATTDLTKSLRWRGKAVEEFFAHYRQPDFDIVCIKDNVKTRAYVYQVNIYSPYSYYAGEDANTVYYHSGKKYTGYDYTLVLSDDYGFIISVQNLAPSQVGNFVKKYGCREDYR